MKDVIVVVLLTQQHSKCCKPERKLRFQTGKVWVGRSLGTPAPKHPVMRPCSLSFLPLTPQHCLPLTLLLFGSQPRLFHVWWVCSVQTGRMAMPPQSFHYLSSAAAAECRCSRHWEVLQLALFGSLPHTLNPSAIAEMQYHDWPGLSQALRLPWYLGYDQAQ